MHRNMVFTIVTAVITLTLANRAIAYECKVCHSKNPKMVAMHKALQGKNCFDCHKIGAKLMGKGQPKDLGSLLQRRATDSACLPCHGKEAAPATQVPSHESPVRP